MIEENVIISIILYLKCLHYLEYLKVYFENWNCYFHHCEISSYLNYMKIIILNLIVIYKNIKWSITLSFLDSFS